jgi:hypothetical protein
MIKSAGLGKELVVTIVNKAGILADISKLLSQEGVNIEAVAGYTVAQEAKIMLVTEDNLRSADALKKAGYKSVKENEVIVIELENKPGALKHVSEILASRGIDIKHIYGAACASACPSRIVLSTSDDEKALVSLNK